MRRLAVAAVTLTAATARADHDIAGGVTLVASYAGEVFVAPALDDDRAAVAGLAELALTVDLATLVDDRLGAARVAGFAIHGDGLSAQLMEVLGVSNNVAEEDVRLHEAWIEQPFGPVTLRAGLLAADEEFVIAEQASLLAGATFGMVGMFSSNVGNPIYPVATPGASARFEHGDVVARAAVYADPHDDHGIPRSLGDEALAFGELALGGAKLGAWHHTLLGSGYHAILDAELDAEHGGFLRAAYSPDGPITSYADAGVRKGTSSVGLAFARTDLGAQTLVEATHQWAATAWLTIQPIAQLVLVR
ncbi:MAG TPA: carbohydrate porin, partial [Xanthomonadales bacterium]|nr:carbohydrate porin [Xanthomonadales bacterium]